MLPKKISTFIFNSVGHKTIKYLKPVIYRESIGDIRKIYDEINLDYVLGPPFTIHAALPELMAGVWSLVRETMIVNRHVNRLTKEAVAGGVSTSNQCPFCVEIHLKMSGGRTEKNKNDIFEWSKNHYSPNSKLIIDPPFSQEEAPEIIGTALAFHYINRMVSVFVTDYPLPVPRFFKFLKPTISSFFKLTAAKNITGLNVNPGTSLKRMPDAILPEEFSWAHSNTHISDCFAGFDTIISRVGENHISFDVRKKILTFLGNWNGDIQEIGNRWLEEEILQIEDNEKKVLARLILLASIQPYKITEQHIIELRKQDYKDEQLIAAASWGSWQATKRISSWLSRAE